MELPVAPLLRALVAEHGACVPQPLAAVVQDAVLDPRAHDARGLLRPQRQAVAVAIGEGVHLLLDDVGDFTDGPLEQLGPLEQRCSDLGIAIGAHEGAHVAFEPLPRRGLGRQHVVHATDCADRLRHRVGLGESRARDGNRPTIGQARPADEGAQYTPSNAATQARSVSGKPAPSRARGHSEQ